MVKEEKKEKEEKKLEKKTEEKTEEEKKEKVEIPKKFADIVKKIEEMSVLDLAELVKLLEKKFGVSTATPMITSALTVPEVGQALAVEEEKSVFNLVLTGIGDKKIEVIKAVRDATEKGLKEAKDLVDAAASSPQVVKENVKKEEAEELKKKFETAGAKVELK